MGRRTRLAAAAQRLVKRRAPPSVGEDGRGNGWPVATGRNHFAAFLSYSRAVDGKLAPALQGALQGFAKPWYSLRALRVFRDDASLSANPGLWSSIEAALHGSDWFVLLASPRAADSAWVSREVSHWLSVKPSERLLLVVTDGEIAWDEAAGDFDWARTSALPLSLAGVFREEPRYIDLRWARSERHLSLGDPRFRDAVADVAAPLHGRPKDEIVGEDVRQHRRAIRIARAAGFVLVALAVAASAFAAYALQQRNTARQERDRAEENARVANSRRLADEAGDRLDQTPKNIDLALLLSLEAYRLAPTVEARSSLLHSVQASPRLRQTLRHANGKIVHDVVFVGDGRVLASAGYDGAVRLWNAAEGRPIAELRGRRSDEVEEVAVSPDASTLASVAKNGTVRLWDIGSDRPRGRTLTRESKQLTDIAFSPDGRTLAWSRFDGMVRLWDRQHNTVRSRRVSRGYVSAMAFSPDGRTFATASGRTVRVWDLKHNRPLAVHPPKALGQIVDIAYSPGGKKLALAGYGGITLWDRARGDTTRFGRREAVFGIAFTPDGATIAAARTNGTVSLWSLRGRPRPLGAALEGHGGPELNGAAVQSVAFSPDGRTLASAGSDGTVRLWDVGRRVALGLSIPVDRSASLGDVTLSLDGAFVAWGAASSVFVRRATGGRHLGGGEAVHRRPVIAVAFSADGTRLASASADGAIRLWDAAGSPLAQPPSNGGDVRAIALSPRATHLASAGSDGTVRIWDVTRRQSTELEGIGIAVYELAFRPDGFVLASGELDGTVRLWDVRRGRQLTTLNGGTGEVRALAFSADGRTLASGNANGEVMLADAVRLRELRTRLRGNEPVLAIAFSHDGKTLASGGRAGSLRLWDVARGAPLGAPLLGHEAPITSLATMPSGTLVSADAYGTVVSWDDFLLRNDYASWRERVCQMVGRSLALTEWQRFLPGEAYRRTCVPRA